MVWVSFSQTIVSTSNLLTFARQCLQIWNWHIHIWDTGLSEQQKDSKIFSLVGLYALSLLQCFDIVSWVTGRTSSMQKICAKFDPATYGKRTSCITNRV